MGGASAPPYTHAIYLDVCSAALLRVQLRVLMPFFCGGPIVFQVSWKHYRFVILAPNSGSYLEYLGIP
jgi:hypothetical protein